MKIARREMQINTLADIKRNMSEKRLFYICDHKISEFIDQVRVPSGAQSNGVYSRIYNNPKSTISLANGGRGSWLEYGKAANWEIDKLTGRCTLYAGPHTRENFVMEIAFLDDECIAELKNRSKAVGEI